MVLAYGTLGPHYFFALAARLVVAAEIVRGWYLDAYIFSIMQKEIKNYVLEQPPLQDLPFETLKSKIYRNPFF